MPAWTLNKAMSGQGSFATGRASSKSGHVPYAPKADAKISGIPYRGAVHPGPITSDNQLGEWETVAADTCRLKVTSGWIFAVYGNDEESPPSLCFVPDVRI